MGIMVDAMMTVQAQTSGMIAAMILFHSLQLASAAQDMKFFNSNVISYNVVMGLYREMRLVMMKGKEDVIRLVLDPIKGMSARRIHLLFVNACLCTL